MKKVLIFSLFAMTVGVSQAQTYAGVEFGVASADISRGDAAEVADYLSYISGQPVGYTLDDSTTSFRLYGGKQFDAKSKLEVGYFSTGKVGADFKGLYYGTAQSKVSAGGLDFSVLHEPFANGFFVKAGLHSSKVKSSATISAFGYSETVSESYSGIGFLYGFGYEKAVADGVNLRGSYVIYNKLGGESDADMNLVSLSLSKNF